MKWKYISLIGIICLTISQCQKKTESIAFNPTEYDLSWAPISIGSWIDYRVDSIRYTKSAVDTSVIIVKSTTYIRELIADTIRDFDTPTQYLVQVFSRTNLSNPWIFRRNQSCYKSAQEYVRNIDNNHYTKLRTPINTSILWNGNKYIDTSTIIPYIEWYNYTNIATPKQVGTFTFDSTLTVVHIADSNAIEKKYDIEIYAKNIGMVYADKQMVQKQNGANPWTMPENGYSVRCTVIDWKR